MYVVLYTANDSYASEETQTLLVFSFVNDQTCFLVHRSKLQNILSYNIGQIDDKMSKLFRRTYVCVTVGCN